MLELRPIFARVKRFFANGQYGVPIALVTGDEAVCREASELLGDGLRTVAVKKGLSRYSARQIPPVRARQMIEDGAREALADFTPPRPYIPAAPSVITIEVGTVDKVTDFRGRAGVEVTGDLTVESRAENWMTAWDQFWPFA